MQLAILNDSHFGARNDLHVFIDYQERFFQNQFFPTIDKLGVKNIIHLGDIFDRRKYVNFYTLQRSRKFFFDQLVERGIKLFVILGNHDVAYKNTNQLNSVELLLSEYSNIVILTEPKVLTFEGTHIGLVPWINQENRDASMEFIRNNSDVAWLGGHFPINGAHMIPGVKCSDGLSPSEFAAYNLVISGHFHTPSKFGNIWYPGNQYDITWNDYGQAKNFLTYNTETNSFTEHLTKERMFHKLYYDDSNEFELKKLQSTLGLFENKYIKLIVNERANKLKFEGFLSELYNNNPYDVRIIDSELVEELSAEEVNIETKTTSEIIDSTIDALSLQVNKDSLKKLFHELYKEALDLEV